MPIYNMSSCYPSNIHHIWHKPAVISEVYMRESLLWRLVIIIETLKHLRYLAHKAYPKTALTMQSFHSHIPSNCTQGIDSFALWDTSLLPLINSMQVEG